MNRAVRQGVLVLLCICAPATLMARVVPLVAGNLVACTLDEPDLSSHTVKIGDPTICYARSLSVFDCSVLDGAQLAGHVAGYHNPGRFHGKGWIQLQFDRLIFPNGVLPVAAKVVSVQGFKVDKEGRILGHGHPRRDAAEWSIPVLWPMKIGTLPMRGPAPALKGERVITVRLLGDARVPCEGYGDQVFGLIK